MNQNKSLLNTNRSLVFLMLRILIQFVTQSPEYLLILMIMDVFWRHLNVFNKEKDNGFRSESKVIGAMGKTWFSPPHQLHLSNDLEMALNVSIQCNTPKCCCVQWNLLSSVITCWAVNLTEYFLIANTHIHWLCNMTSVHGWRHLLLNVFFFFIIKPLKF